MNRAELKSRAIALEQALEGSTSQSRDVAAFAQYEPLVSAIKRAKAGEIHVPEELPGMRYWMFETDIPSFPELELAFSHFSVMLRGWDT